MEQQFSHIKKQYDKNYERALALNAVSRINRRMSPSRTRNEDLREIRYLRSRITTLENRMR